MKQYIDKEVIAAEIEGLKRTTFSNFDEGVNAAAQILLDFLDTLEVKEMSIPALDNGNMPIKRWKEACNAASCQANYRKSKGLTETCNDYFVDGVQWADEHPNATEQHLKVNEVDLEKELDRYTNSAEYVYNETRDSYFLVAKHFFELGLKAKDIKENEWKENNIKPPFVDTMDGNKYSEPVLCRDKFGGYFIAKYVRWQTGYCGWFDDEKEISITHWKELT